MDKPTEQKPSSRFSAGLVAALVVALFVLPIGVAWWMVWVQPPSGNAMLNRGTLIQPPLDIRSETALAPLRSMTLGPGEWAMVYFTTATCAAACKENIEKMNQVFRVLSHDQTRVQRATVLAEKSDLLGRQSDGEVMVDQALARRLARAAVAEPNGVSTAAGIVLLDWRGKVMLYFDHSQPPQNIKKDLKRLLRGSKIK